MDFERVKKHFEEKGFQRSRSLRKEFQNKRTNYQSKTKIIGITGSKGKSTVAYLIHEYLKRLNYKTILYSSIKIDSPASSYSNKVSKDIALYNEKDILNMIAEVEAYAPDFLILEVNESTIDKKLTDLIDFDIKVLTNFNSKHNLDLYTEEEYLKIKKAFFKNSSKDTICIFGLQDYTKDVLEQFLTINDCHKKIYSSRHIAMTKGVNENIVDYLLYDLHHSLSGLDMKFLKNKKSYFLKTNLLMNYNALNILGLVSVIDTLGLYDGQTLTKFLQDIKIPGRVEKYNFNNFMVIIDTQLSAALYELYNYKQKGLINNIIVVTGSFGYGYKNWDPKFNTTEFVKLRQKNRFFAADILKKYADFVYLTENESGKEGVYDICLELQNNLNNYVKSEIVLDREEAIKKAIKKAQTNDVILISGRGNRSILCDTETKAKVFRDKDIIIKHFDWEEYDG
ncbi:MAG: hypothetical protein IKC22_04905 [Bacilli bacterium]|nr:hypothetical protein [Bacilli bacterium]